MAINTLITLKDAIDVFVAGHKQLKRVEWEADDYRAPKITEGDEFPVLFVAPIDVNVGRAMNTHTLRMYIYERLNDDRLDVIENANDTSLILRDIRVWWNDYGIDDINIVDDFSGTFASDRELDNLVGYYADVRFEIPSHGRCQVPVNVTPIPPIGCADATYQITDSDNTDLYTGTIQSGGNLSQPIQNSTAILKDTDGNTLSTTSILAEGSEDIIAPDSTYTVQYENGTPIESGNILSGGSVLVEVPDPVTCPDTSLEVNGTSEGTFNAGSTIDIQLSDSGGVVTPDSVTVVGNDVQIVLADAVAPTYASARLVKSGVTTSYADYDAGFYQRGRELSFYKLKSNNPYGHNWRFTGTSGGYYDSNTSQYKLSNGTVSTFASAFPNSIMIDWTTRDATGVQLWALQTFSLPSVTWDVARTNCKSLTVGGLSTWALPETVEYDSLRNWGLAGHHSWLPLNFEIAFWSANTNPSSITVAFYKSSTQWAGSGKTNSLKYIPTRWTLLSEIGL